MGRRARKGGDDAAADPPLLDPHPDAPDLRAALRPDPRPGPLRRLRRVLALAALSLAGLVLLALLLLARLNPPATPYMLSESRRLGGVSHEWVPMEAIAPVMARAVVAAEDADFCLHWGLDVSAIRAALAEGAGRGGSTISQQVVKNVFLWPERSWARKAIEAALTPLVEAVWTKRRILEMYLNVAEFGEGVFGVEAGARHWFGVGAAGLTDAQAARLAAILPSPRTRDPANPTDALRERAATILDGAATIEADGRSACWEGAASPADP